MAQAKGYSFTNHMKNAYGSDKVNAEYQRFSEEYFAGSDVRIYFGKTWVDEIVALNFTLQENAAPIFGYASYTYDKMAVGSRQISGTFRINFKESYYLHSITNRLDSELEGIYNADKQIPGTQAWISSASEITPEHLTSAVEGDDFEKMALDFERSLWGGADASQENQNGAMNGRTLNRRNASFFAQEDGRPNLAKHGFNIVILYGPYTQTYNSELPKESVATTAHTLTGVYLTGVNQVIDGGQIFEDYSFIAKDLDANVNVYQNEPSYKFGKLVK